MIRNIKDTNLIKNQILLIEDDEDVILWIKEYLEEFGFNVTAHTTVTDALSKIRMEPYDLILLDINLPDFNGYEVLKYLQTNKIDIPVIVTSAYSDRKNKIYAFNLGAVDYMTKPLDLEELEARIRVHIRRKNHPVLTKSKIFEIKNNIILHNTEALNLTKIEFDILEKLIQNKNTTLKREVLCESLSSLSSTRTLDYHIRNIRKKIKDDGAISKYLITEYGYGYKLVCD